MRDLNKKAKKDKTFTFDNVYGPDSTNEQVKGDVQRSEDIYLD